MMRKLTQLPQPVIARVHGIATAAGCQLVSLCDLAVASDSAKFALPGGNIGRKRSMEMLLTGETVDAATALQWGLINRAVPGEQLAVPGEQLDEEIQHFVDRILGRSGAAIALGKKAFYTQIESGLSGAFEVAGDAMVCNLKLADAAEGIDAFLAKRPASRRNA